MYVADDRIDSSEVDAGEWNLAGASWIEARALVGDAGWMDKTAKRLRLHVGPAGAGTATGQSGVIHVIATRSRWGSPRAARPWPRLVEAI